MKENYKIPDGLKDFCRTVWIFSGVLLGLMLLYYLGDHDFRTPFTFELYVIGSVVCNYFGMVHCNCKKRR